MLNNRNLEEKTIEELITEALMEVPLYTKEWTNFNPSDPGVTILENLTAFHAVQTNRINEITPQVRQKLLKMAGFEAKRGRCARVLLAPEGLTERMQLTSNQKFLLGDLCFETNRSMEIGAYQLMGVYAVREEKTYDFSYLLDREVEVPVSIFGEEPQAGSSLWFTCDQLPEPGEEILFYLTVAGRHNRNSFGEKSGSAFAKLRWECYTEEGFVEMNVRDLTGCFLSSGEIRMRLPGERAVPCPEAPDRGYAIRAVLEEAHYDVQPKLKDVSGFLFEVWQKDTKAACYTFNRIVNASLPRELIKDGYVMVFCKEQKGSSYKRYNAAYGAGIEGRFFELSVAADGTHTWYFDKKKYGYGPEKLKNAIKIVSYSEEMMRQYSLGTVLGMDDQEIKLPAEQIVAESFCIIAKRIDEQGEEIYDFVRPSRLGEEDLTYYLYENQGKIVIEDAGSFIGAELYIGTLSTTRGAQGNIRPGNLMQGIGLSNRVSFYNPTPGTGGALRETLDDVKRRFIQDIKKPYTAVTADDYERLVKETPQLCIDKVKAFIYEPRNLVRIAVKPGTDEEFPELPGIYEKAILEQLEDKRLLTTKIEIIPPMYVPIDVHGTVYMKSQYENARQMIEDKLREKIDYIHSEKNFGEVLKFDEVFHAVEALDCVEFVYELSLTPQKPGMARMSEADIIPNENCLCYAGEIRLELGSYMYEK